MGFLSGLASSFGVGVRGFFTQREQVLLGRAQQDILNGSEGDILRAARCIDLARFDYQRVASKSRIDVGFSDFLSVRLARCGVVRWGDVVSHYELHGLFGELDWAFRLWVWADKVGVLPSRIPRNIDDLMRIEEISFFYGHHERDSVARLARVESFDSLDRFSELPLELFNVKVLRRIVLGDGHEGVHSCEKLNYLEDIPREISSLPDLEFLALQYNGIKYLPHFIGDLRCLKYLKLGGNFLRTLPPEIGRLQNLKVLTVWDNEIEFIPREIGQLSRLEGLSLWGNPLETLPVEICNLKSLNVLEIMYMPNLKLSMAQVEWVNYLVSRGCAVYFDKNLIGAKMDDDIPF